MLAGFPLLAEGQVGALYPINLLLYKFFPTHHALSFNILLRIAWAGCGMYVFTRARGIGSAGALLAGFVFSFNGVVLGQMFHPPILFTVAWLPWLLFLVARFQRWSGQPTCSTGKTRRAIWFALAALALGVQFLCGSVQMAFLNALAVAVFGVSQSTVRRSPSMVYGLLPIALLALGGGIAAIQLLPTSELIGYSVRAGALGKEFVTSYSMPPEYLVHFVAPFAPGEPAEGNAEYRAYFGIAPLLLALSAVALRRNRQTILFAAFALVALALALGELNPAYQLLFQLPLFNFFRVPARYLCLFVFAAAFLSAVGFDGVIARSGLCDEAISESRRGDCFVRLVMTKRARAFFACALLTLGAIVLAHTQPPAFWLDAWRGLPLALGGGCVQRGCARVDAPDHARRVRDSDPGFDDLRSSEPRAAVSPND